VQYYGADLTGAHLPFNFQLINSTWDARHLAKMIFEYETAIPDGGWPNWVLGNHDQHRIATRVGAAQARVAAMLLLTLRGTPTMYYGDEIGMHDVQIPPERIQDPFEKNVPGRGLGRDPERTPMQWCARPKAGFTTGEPWLPIAEDFGDINVEKQRDDPASMLSFYQRLLALRRGEPALEVGRFEPMDADGDVLAFIRRARENEAEFLIALNLGSRPQELRIYEAGAIALSTHLDRFGERVEKNVALRPDEGVIVRLAS